MSAREFMRRRRGALALPALALTALLAAGCAVTPPHAVRAGDAAWQRHVAWVREQPGWLLSGRFALVVDGRGWTASLHWRQQGDVYRIDIFDPLGRTVARLDGDSLGVSLRADGKPSRKAASAAALMQSELGWSLPVAGLRYWVRGVPMPDTQPTELRIDGSGRAAELVQDGWDVHYLDYDNAFGAKALPTRLQLTRGKVRLTLLVDHWGAAQ